MPNKQHVYKIFSIYTYQFVANIFGFAVVDSKLKFHLFVQEVQLDKCLSMYELSGLNWCITVCKYGFFGTWHD